MPRLLALAAVLLSVFACAPSDGDWRAGVAAADITPSEPVWMSGYGSRTEPSQGVAQPLHAKALALEDPSGRRLVVVTTDLIGFSRTVAERIAERAGREHGLERAAILLTSSHTHTGPALADNLPLMAPPTPELAERTARYTAEMERRVARVVAGALADLTPARLSYHVGRATFARNRRERTPDGAIRLGDNPAGPVDHSVPVLRVASEDGALRAALFSYAAHNTTLTGRHMEFHGDYAGFVQEFFERDHPGATALFMTGCAGDANPIPRGEIEHAAKHGRELAEAVAAAMATEGVQVRGSLRTSFERFPIRLEPPPDRTAWERMAAEAGEPERSLARIMLSRLDAGGEIAREYEYPLHVARLGDSVALVALGGEVAVEYALQLRQALGEATTWVVAYANDVMAYIPTAKILAEGGYEAERSQTWYGMPAKWQPSIERTILDRAEAAVRRLE